MKIFFAGSQGQELKNDRLFELITRRRLLSFFYMSKNLDEGYFGDEKKVLENVKKR